MQNAKGTGPILHTTYMSPKCILEWKCTFVAARLPHQFGWGFFYAQTSGFPGKAMF